MPNMTTRVAVWPRSDSVPRGQLIPGSVVVIALADDVSMYLPQDGDSVAYLRHLGAAALAMANKLDENVAIS